MPFKKTKLRFVQLICTLFKHYLHKSNLFSNPLKEDARISMLIIFIVRDNNLNQFNVLKKSKFKHTKGYKIYDIFNNRYDKKLDISRLGVVLFSVGDRDLLHISIPLRF